MLRRPYWVLVVSDPITSRRQASQSERCKARVQVKRVCVLLGDSGERPSKELQDLEHIQCHRCLFLAGAECIFTCHFATVQSNHRMRSPEVRKFELEPQSPLKPAQPQQAWPEAQERYFFQIMCTCQLVLLDVIPSADIPAAPKTQTAVLRSCSGPWQAPTATAGPHSHLAIYGRGIKRHLPSGEQRHSRVRCRPSCTARWRPTQTPEVHALIWQDV